jgi:chemotaxis protein CheD
MQEGAERSRLQAKVFGGGHVLKTASHDGSVPRRNIRFARSFLTTEGIPILKEDTGGLSARAVLFFTDSGKVLMKRLTPTGSDAARVDEIRREEAQAEQTAVQDVGDVTLF